MLSGKFDNEEQVRFEALQGERIHPIARHIITPCNHMISNLPPAFQGVFVIEESYFDMGDRIIDKHYLFLYEEVDESNVRLTSFDLPKNIEPEKFVISIRSIPMDYRYLKISPRFTPLLLEKEGNGYYGKNVSNFGPGKTFKFSLRVSENGFEAKELLEVDGERYAGYDTPIIYRRTV